MGVLAKRLLNRGIKGIRGKRPSFEEAFRGITREEFLERKLMGFLGNFPKERKTPGFGRNFQIFRLFQQDGYGRSGIWGHKDLDF